MLRKNSIVKFVLLIIIAIIGVLLCVCPFNVPASTNRYNGFVFAIDKGLDLNGGVSAIYSVEKRDNQDKSITEIIDESIEKLEKSLDENTSYSQIEISRQGEKIRLEISNAYETDSTFANLEESKTVLITLDEASDTVTNPEVHLRSSDIDYTKIGYDYENSAYTIELKLTKEGERNLKQLKRHADEIGKSSIYLYLDETTSDNLLSTVNIDDIDESIIFTSSSTDYSSTSSTAMTQLAYSITCGAMGLDLTLLEASYISPVLGTNTLLFLGIASIITIVLALAFMIIRYGDLGLLGSLSTIFYLVLFAFFMQAIPFITLNLSAMFGCIFAFILVIVSNCLIFEKVKEEYSIGKKIHLSFKGGLKKALWPILDSHAVLIIATALMWIFAPAMLKGFAITLMLGTMLSVFTSLVLTRYFMNIYLPINSTKAKRLHLYRDKNVKEIKEEIEVVQENEVTNYSKGGNINE